ncbi:MAG: glycosyl transferase, partial [Crenarchaeota archaeon]|nr:glycosyl transferase [Thermoproteota archaeon]
LPNQFVLKCTHDSGGLIICKDKSKLDIKAAKKKINTSLKRNYYWYFREWPYKNVKPRIIAEKYMVDGNNIVPEDFKVYCINEEPKYIVIFHNRFNKNKVLAETVYDTDLNIIDCSFSEHFKAIKQDFPYPEAKDLLLKLSKFLSAGFRQIRTDFYIINGKIYFGELTLYTASGLTHFVPNEWDIKLGNLLNLGIENHE